MGEEVEIDIEALTECAYCGNELDVKAAFTEYPACFYDSGPYYQSDGCDIMVPPDISHDTGTVRTAEVIERYM